MLTFEVTDSSLVPNYMWKSSLNGSKNKRRFHFCASLAFKKRFEPIQHSDTIAKKRGANVFRGKPTIFRSTSVEQFWSQE